MTLRDKLFIARMLLLTAWALIKLYDMRLPQ